MVKKNVKNHSDFVEKVNEKFGNEYDVIGEYVNSESKVLVRHNICGYKWEVWSNNLFSGRSKCPNCSQKAKHTTATFIAKVNKLNKGFTIKSEYVNNQTKVDIQHECGYEWQIRPVHLFSMKVSCPRCQKRERYTTEGFRNKIIEATDGEFDLISEYVKNYEDLDIKHVPCGKEFKAKPTTFLQSSLKCPDCNESMSKGESGIHNYLTSKSIEFNAQHTFEDCKSINLLRFDFAILDNNKVRALIEYDGKQHYEPIEWFGGEESFKGVQKRDKIKNKYCKDNNIPLLRIPYWDENDIPRIIEDFLNQIQ